MRTKGMNNVTIQTLKDCTPQRHLVKGYTSNGKCYAALVHIDTPMERIKEMINNKEIDYFPYNETTGEFI